MADAEVGRLFIRVMPDLDGFRAETKRKADAVEKTLDPIRVEMEIDGDQAEREAERTMRYLESITKPINVPIEVDSRDAVRQAEQADAEIDAALEDTKTVNIEVRKDRLDTLKKDINNAVGSEPVDVPLSARLQDLRQRIYSELKPKVKPIDLDFDMGKARGIGDEIRESIEGQVQMVRLDAVGDNLRESIRNALTASKDAYTVDVDGRMDMSQVQRAVERTKLVAELDVDEDGTLENIRRMGDKIHAELRTVDPRVKASIDESYLKSSLKDALNVKSEMPPIKANIDKEHLKTNVANSMKVLSRMKPYDLMVGADFKKFRRDLAKANLRQSLADSMTLSAANMKQWTKLSGDIKRASRSLAEFKQSYASVQQMINSRVLKDPFKVFTRSTGLRVLWDLHREKFQAFANFDQIALKVGGLGIAMQSLGGIMAATLGNILSWANGLGQIVRAGIVLPGILAGMGAAAWAASAAFKEFDKYLPGVKQQFEGLNKAMSAKFWAEAQKPMRNMINVLFPELEAGMRKVATATGTFFAKFSEGMGRNFTGALGPMLDSVAQGVQAASAGMDGFTKGLRYLLQIGTDQLPALGQAFTDMSNKFGDSMEELYSNGTLQEWVDKGISSLQALGSVLWDTGSILGMLGTYAREAGGATLESLAETMAGVKEVVASSGFKTMFVDMMGDVYAFTHALGTSLTQGLGSFLSSIGPIMSEALRNLAAPMALAIDGLFDGLSSKASAANFTTFFAGLNEGFSAIAAVAETLGSKISIVFALIGTAFANLAPVVASFIEEIAVVLERIQGPATEFMETMGTSLKQVMEGLSPVFEVLADAFARLLEIITPLAGSFGGWGDVLASAAPVVEGIANAMLNFLEPVIKSIADAMPGLQAAWTSLMEALTPLMPVFETIGSILGTVAGILIGVFLSAITSIIGGIAGFIAGLQQIWTGLTQVFEGIKQILQGNFAEGFSTLWEGIKNIFSGAMSAIWNAIVVWANVTLIGAIRGGIVKLLASWKGGWQGILTFAKSIWTNIVNGVRGFITNAGNFIKTGISNIKKVWEFGWRTLLTLMKVVVYKIIVAVVEFVTSVGNKVKAITGKFKSAMDKTVSAVRGFFTNFVKAGAHIISGIVRGITNGAAAVIDAARQVASDAFNAAKSFLGIQSPSRLFKELGHYTSLGLAEGIANSGHLAVGAVKDIAKDMSKVPFELSEVDVPTGSMAKFSASAYGALNGEAVEPGGVTITQTFNESNVDAAESYRLLRMGIKTARMSGAYPTH